MSLTNQIKFIERERIKQIHQPNSHPTNEQTKEVFQFSSLCLHTQAPGLLMRLLNFIVLKYEREQSASERQTDQPGFSIKFSSIVDFS